jgi:hypothetical protein
MSRWSSGFSLCSQIRMAGRLKPELQLWQADAWTPTQKEATVGFEPTNNGFAIL